MKDYLQNCRIQELSGFTNRSIRVAALRLDLIHPVVSGNKWFKLRYYLEEARLLNKTHIASFGGAYSNHIIATAFAAKEAGFTCTGFIRGEEPVKPGSTLTDARALGMETIFISRDVYRNKQDIIKQSNRSDTYWIPEGGYGLTGAKGAATIMDIAGTDQFTHIICATGTGTMMAGLIKGAKPGQEIMGISILKNHLLIEDEVRFLLDEADNEKTFSFIHGYHFGGYAKHPPSLIRFMKEVWEEWQVPTDIVYTSKLFFAVTDLLQKKYFPVDSRILIIHSGGLQGNQSLPFNTLPF